MGLLVRLKHALGERVLDLPERQADDPLVVGRAGDADIKIPSVNVAPRHLVLFVHEGSWVVQDGPGSTGTRVNGVPLTGAQALRGGDVLTLGTETNAPTLQIDPSSIPAHPGVQTSQPAGGSISTSAHVSAPPPVGRMVQAAPPVPPAAPEEQYEQYDASAPAGESGGDDTAWMTDMSGSTAPVARSLYVPKRRKSSDAAVAFAVVASLAVLAGVGGFIYLQVKKQEAATAQMTMVPPPVRKPVIVEDVPKKAPVAPRVATKPTAIAAAPPPPPVDPTDQLDEPPPPPKPKPKNAKPLVTTRPSPPPRPTIPAPGPSDTTAMTPPVPENQLTEMPDDPADPEAAALLKDWKHVESAYYNPNIAKALMAIDAYAEAHPNSRGQQIEQFREDLLDKLWWDRVTDLIQRRKDLTDGIKKTEQDLKDETEAAFKKTVLEPRLEDQKGKVVKVTDKLVKEMQYSAATPPPINKDAEMRKLREQRDSSLFKQWKAKVLLSIRQNHGALPWANER